MSHKNAYALCMTMEWGEVIYYCSDAPKNAFNRKGQRVEYFEHLQDAKTLQAELNQSLEYWRIVEVKFVPMGYNTIINILNYE